MSGRGTKRLRASVLHQQLCKWDCTAERRLEEGNGSEADSGEFSRAYSRGHSTVGSQRIRRANFPAMSSQELPGSFGVLFPKFSLPMKAERSRNKERLEASLAGLCELELLKQRQECRVLSALCLGDSPVSGRPPWGALRSELCTLDAPNGSASDDYGLRPQIVSSVCLNLPLYWMVHNRCPASLLM